MTRHTAERCDHDREVERDRRMLEDDAKRDRSHWPRRGLLVRHRDDPRVRVWAVVDVREETVVLRGPTRIETVVDVTIEDAVTSERMRVRLADFARDFTAGDS